MMLCSRGDELGSLWVLGEMRVKWNAVNALMTWCVPVLVLPRPLKKLFGYHNCEGLKHDLWAEMYRVETICYFSALETC